MRQVNARRYHPTIVGRSHTNHQMGIVEADMVGSITCPSAVETNGVECLAIEYIGSKRLVDSPIAIEAFHVFKILLVTQIVCCGRRDGNRPCRYSTIRT